MRFQYTFLIHIVVFAWCETEHILHHSIVQFIYKFIQKLFKL